MRIMTDLKLIICVLLSWLPNSAVGVPFRFVCPVETFCVTLPPRCVRDCLVTVSANPILDTQTLDFQLRGESEIGKYVAVALSLDDRMESSYAFACINNGSWMGVLRVWLRSAQALAEDVIDPAIPGLSNQNVRIINEVLSCNFSVKFPVSHQQSPTSPVVMFTPTNHTTFLLIARGITRIDRPWIGNHPGGTIGRLSSTLELIWGAPPQVETGHTFTFSCPPGDLCLEIDKGCDNKCTATVRARRAETLGAGSLDFELKGIPGNYTVAGISIEGRMANTFAIGCVHNGIGLVIRSMYLSDFTFTDDNLFNETEHKKLVFDEEAKILDNVTICKFSVKFPMVFDDVVFDPIDGLSLLIAFGDSRTNSPFLRFHKQKHSSDFKITREDVGFVGPRVSDANTPYVDRILISKSSTVALFLISILYLFVSA